MRVQVPIYSSIFQEAYYPESGPVSSSLNFNYQLKNRKNIKLVWMDRGKWVSHIQFHNLIFRYANVQLPAGNTNDAQGSLDFPAVIILKGAQHCVFTDCTVNNIGGFAFDIQEGSAYNQFMYNQLSNIAGGGFRINGGTYADHPLLQMHNNIISDNEIVNYIPLSSGSIPDAYT